jgi:hypothetical protein
MRALSAPTPVRQVRATNTIIILKVIGGLMFFCGFMGCIATVHSGGAGVSAIIGMLGLLVFAAGRMMQ